nr:zinc ribbon domain-containing protein [Pseudodesulfovibrio sp.]
MAELVNCPTCKQPISAAAEACPSCGHPMVSAVPTHEPAAAVRKGLTNAKFNEERANILYAEVIIIAIIIGFASQSWWIFGASVVALLITLAIPALTMALAILLSLGWAGIGYSIGDAFSDGMGAPLVLCFIGLICGLGTHLAALEWHEDIN